MSLLCSHDVGHAWVTTGRRAISVPSFLTTEESHPSSYSNWSIAPSTPIKFLNSLFASIPVKFFSTMRFVSDQQ